VAQTRGWACWIAIPTFRSLAEIEVVSLGESAGVSLRCLHGPPIVANDIAVRANSRFCDFGSRDETMRAFVPYATSFTRSTSQSQKNHTSPWIPRTLTGNTVGLAVALDAVGVEGFCIAWCEAGSGGQHDVFNDPAWFAART
jgi:hypothetical protein